jgi:exonuclease III
MAFLEDFSTALKEWVTAGDAIIVCGDINQNILSHEITTFFNDIGLRHLIFSKHDNTTAPATYIR